VTLVISGYAVAVLKRRAAGLAILIGLALLYLVLYSLLQLEDYALLVGAIGLFLLLAGAMWATRKVDWYRVELGRRDAGSS
jgi:inner membrane protein